MEAGSLSPPQKWSSKGTYEAVWQAATAKGHSHGERDLEAPQERQRESCCGIHELAPLWRHQEDVKSEM
jgi:hypothetical protein